MLLARSSSVSGSLGVFTISQYHGETKIPISQKPFKRFAKYLLIALSCGAGVYRRYWSILRVLGARSYLFLCVRLSDPATLSVYTQVETLHWVVCVITTTHKDFHWLPGTLVATSHSQYITALDILSWRMSDISSKTVRVWATQWLVWHGWMTQDVS